MPTPNRDARRPSIDYRRPSHAGSASSQGRRHSVKSDKGGEGRRASLKSNERDKVRLGSRTSIDTNLRSPTDDVFYDAYEKPLRSPRRGSRNSKLSLVSYGVKGADSDVVFDVNIAVLGNEKVGKSTFIQRALDLDADDLQSLPSRILAIGGSLCMVRMFEMRIEEVYRGENEALCWPDRIESIPMHGVITLYDVGNKASFRLVPEVLNAVNKMSLPSVLAACKCDIRDGGRQLEPKAIGQRASSAFDRITTLQTSENTTESFRKAISALLRVVVDPSYDHPDGPVSPRRRTLPNIPGPLSPRRPSAGGHSRSNSEVPGFKPRYDLSSFSSESGRNGSSLASKSTSISSFKPDDMSSSFLMDESHTEDSASHTSLSVHETDLSETEAEQGVRTPQTPSEEHGWSFDALVNRLLALPTAKSDSKFAAVFLALYRKFAPPGQLLEAIVVRFEALEHTEAALLARAVAQLRYLTVVEQWINLYPGDFAHPKTLRRIRTFIAKLRKNKMFAAAAREMDNNLEFVTEDDDTEWACCDKDRDITAPVGIATEWSYRGSLLIDDPNFQITDDIGRLSLASTGKDINKESDALSRVSTNSSLSRRSKTQFEDVARREASKLTPLPRLTLSKNSWRMLLQFSDEAIAKEMTRMDWIMFSSIRPRDLVRHVSLSPAQKTHCKSLANVSRMIDHFNYVRDWVINFVLFRDKPKHRALMLEKFMQVARKLRELNNYNSLGAVLAGLHSTSVHRLQLTKDFILGDVTKDWMKLEILMAQTRSFYSYRLAWENSNGERIPYLPLPIRDLVGAATGNKTFVGEGPCARINWKKFEVMGDVLVGIQRAQGVPYRSSILGQRNDDIRTLLLQTKIERDDDVSLLRL
ncbi:ras GEF [Myriangium duriaei CBS 260.36]|uniref:Ras GEF n=1 Tax=Myriangium duriaei CBS 260.36 TaxID=1168546 RepID=A0A9P4J9F2_9PEZI|nr:ras GEF [Myriangium duriaei CBS 260.36]